MEAYQIKLELLQANIADDEKKSKMKGLSDYINRNKQ
jgi:hypothetical protein